MANTKEYNLDMAKLAVDALEDKKADNVRLLDISSISSLADYFIIASGSNRNQMQALADNVSEKLGRAGYEKISTEGYDSANWILLDYGDVVIHMFDKESRAYFDLDRIWNDGIEIN